MPKKYLQLTYEDRRLISHWRAKGLSVTEIAIRVNVHKSTISRELKRNGRRIERANLEFYLRLNPFLSEQEITAELDRISKIKFDWSATEAQRVREYRLKLANQLRRRKKPETARWVISKLKEHWSPEQIAGRSAIEGPERVSYEYVYRLLHEDKKRGGRLYRLLKRFGKRKQRLGERIYPHQLQIPNRRSIEKRPKLAQYRKRLGDLEADLILGASQSGYVLSVIDRKSRFMVLRKLRTKRKRTVRVQLERALRKMGQVKTLTVDNGTEFFDHQTLTRLTGVPVFFTHPYCSTDKGSIENANALVRYFLPKRTSFKKLTQKKLNKIEEALNQRPRKVLGYLTPKETHFKSQNQSPQSLLLHL